MYRKKYESHKEVLVDGVLSLFTYRVCALGPNGRLYAGVAWKTAPVE